MAYEVKTTKNDASVALFIDAISVVQQREDAIVLCNMMEEISQCPPSMWGGNIIGFDEYVYKYKSGRQGVLFKVGFAPRKKYLAIYLMPGYQEYGEILKTLGKYSVGKCCLNVPSLAVVHTATLITLITQGYNDCADSYDMSGKK